MRVGIDALNGFFQSSIMKAFSVEVKEKGDSKMGADVLLSH